MRTSSKIWSTTWIDPISSFTCRWVATKKPTNDLDIPRSLVPDSAGAHPVIPDASQVDDKPQARLKAHLVADLLVVAANLALRVADGQGCPVHRQCGFSGKLVDA